ncbi:MAG: pyrimidine 5'-nucleotidase, partial [Pseudomonadota bacterium]
AKDGIAAPSSAMFEDEERNLKVPHAMGMKTVHVHPDRHEADHIHHHTNDLADFLSQLSR